MIRQMPDTIEEFIENITDYGLPTYAEFCKNKTKWMGGTEETMNAIEIGDRSGNRDLRCKQELFIEQYKMDGPEQCQRIAKDMGYDIDKDFHMDVQILPSHDWKFVSRITFRPKKNIKNSLFDHRLKGRV